MVAISESGNLRLGFGDPCSTIRRRFGNRRRFLCEAYSENYPLKLLPTVKAILRGCFKVVRRTGVRPVGA